LFVYIYSLILSGNKEKAKEEDAIDEDRPRHGSRGRILIIDDEEDITFFLKEALEGSGSFEVVTFNDPLVALSSFNDKDGNNLPSAYDLILLDIKMPKMDGFELYQEIQKRINPAARGGGDRGGSDNARGNNGKKTKICFMTAFEVYYEALRELFPDSYSSICFIKKPSSTEDLIRRINKEI
jgi:two-component system, OmpR family, response regulator ChvI